MIIDGNLSDMEQLNKGDDEEEWTPDAMLLLREAQIEVVRKTCRMKVLSRLVPK